MTKSITEAFVDAEQLTDLEDLAVLIPQEELGDFNSIIEDVVSNIFEFIGRLEPDDTEGDQKLANYLGQLYGTAFVAGCYYSVGDKPAEQEKQWADISIELSPAQRVELARRLLGQDGITLELFG
jgi:hypothetical protein